MAFDPPAGPSYNVINYDFDKDPPRLAYAASITNAATYNPSTGEIEFDDMNAFKEAGGKLLIWHGWADASVPPQHAVDFYEALGKKEGGIAVAQDFARLFMVPGMDHCGFQGPGLSGYGHRSIDRTRTVGRGRESAERTNCDQDGTKQQSNALAAAGLRISQSRALQGQR